MFFLLVTDNSNQLCPKSLVKDRINGIDKIRYSFCWFEILKIFYILSNVVSVQTDSGFSGKATPTLKLALQVAHFITQANYYSPSFCFAALPNYAR